jgi:hypothetical protein
MSIVFKQGRTVTKPIADDEARVGPTALVPCIVARWGVLIYYRSDQPRLLVESLFVAYKSGVWYIFLALHLASDIWAALVCSK